MTRASGPCRLRGAGESSIPVVPASLARAGSPCHVGCHCGRAIRLSGTVAAQIVEVPLPVDPGVAALAFLEDGVEAVLLEQVDVSRVCWMRKSWEPVLNQSSFRPSFTAGSASLVSSSLSVSFMLRKSRPELKTPT